MEGFLEGFGEGFGFLGEERAGLGEAVEHEDADRFLVGGVGGGGRHFWGDADEKVRV